MLETLKGQEVHGVAEEDSSFEIAANKIPKPKAGETRRRFLAKLGIGAVALALVGGPLGILTRARGASRSASNLQFPGEDSIFHPATDPRTDPRRLS